MRTKRNGDEIDNDRYGHLAELEERGARNG